MKWAAGDEGYCAFLYAGVFVGVDGLLHFAEFVGHAVVDDPDSGEGGEVGEQLHVEGIEVVVALTDGTDDASYGHTFGESRGEAAGDYGVATVEFGVARQLFEHCMARVPAFPDERTELLAAFDFGRQAQVGVEQRDDACRVRTYDVDYTYHAVLVHDTHLRAYAVERPFFDGDVVVGTCYGIVDYVRYDEVVTGERGVDCHRVGIFAFAEPCQLVAQLQHLLFEFGIATLEVFVDVTESEIGCHRTGGAVYA